MQSLQAEVDRRQKLNASKNVPLPSQGQSMASSGSLNVSSFRQESYDPKKRKATGDSAIEKAFNIGAREQVNEEIARMFYTAGLPFHLARNPHYQRAFNLASNLNVKGYVPPGYNMLRTKLLANEKEHVDRLLVPIKQAWNDKGVTIVCDGWSDPQRRPLINFIAITEGGAMFLKAVNTEGEIKDKFYIASLIKEVILEVGSQNVVQVITDNAANCKGPVYLLRVSFQIFFGLHVSYIHLILH